MKILPSVCILFIFFVFSCKEIDFVEKNQNYKAAQITSFEENSTLVEDDNSDKRNLEFFSKNLQYVFKGIFDNERISATDRNKLILDHEKSFKDLEAFIGCLNAKTSNSGNYLISYEMISNYLNIMEKYIFYVSNSSISLNYPDVVDKITKLYIFFSTYIPLINQSSNIGAIKTRLRIKIDEFKTYLDSKNTNPDYIDEMNKRNHFIYWFLRKLEKVFSLLENNSIEEAKNTFSNITNRIDKKDSQTFINVSDLIKNHYIDKMYTIFFEIILSLVYPLEDPIGKGNLKKEIKEYIKKKASLARYKDPKFQTAIENYTQRRNLINDSTKTKEEKEIDLQKIRRRNAANRERLLLQKEIPAFQERAIDHFFRLFSELGF